MLTCDITIKNHTKRNKKKFQQACNAAGNNQQDLIEGLTIHLETDKLFSFISKAVVGGENDLRPNSKAILPLYAVLFI